jgi:hypothetical protein
MQEIPKIVLERLQKESAAEIHPDANLLTAFAERALAGGEQVKMVKHLAHCGDCREVIALALPALEEVGANAAIVEGRRSWFSWPALRWGLVAAGVAAVASVGVVQFEHRQVQDGALSAEVARNEPAAGTVSSVEVPATIAANTPSENMAGSRKNSFETNPVAQKVPAKGKQARTPTVLPTVALEEKSAIAQNQIADQLVHRSASSPDVVKAKNPAPAETAGAIAGPNVALQTEPAMMVRALPRWSISANGGLQRSFDAGGSWEDVNVEADDYSPQAANEAGGQGQSEKKAGMPPVFRAVAAIGSEVWAGGVNGLLYHSADSGTRWMRVSPSSGDAVLTGDISGIQFSDTQHGAITTSSGEVWTTSDSGQIWIRRP